MAVSPFSPPQFVSMSNAPSPFPNPRQLQRPVDNAANHRIQAMQAAAAALNSPPGLLSPATTTSHNHSLPSPPLPPPPPPPPFPVLTTDEAMAVLRQQLSLRCVSFLSQPGRDVRQLPAALLQVVAGLPVGVGSAMVQDTLRALGLGGVLIQSSERSGSNITSGRGNGSGRGSSGSTGSHTAAGSNNSNVSSPSTNDYLPTLSASSASPSAYTTFSATSTTSTAVPLYNSSQSAAASILLSPLSMMDSHRALYASPMAPMEAASMATPQFSSSPLPGLSSLAGSLTSSPPPALRGGRSLGLAQLQEWLSALPASSGAASLYQQRLLPAHQSQADGMARSRSHSFSHSAAHAAAAAAVGQQKLLQLATPRNANSRLSAGQ